ncbi:MAG: DUF5615 family PIN-like protein [Micrococcales bacterium]|nr:DUF5615 family PIN-like protein [Micrococcales bacterium]
MKIIIDMNLSPRWVAYLVEAGIDATHWSDIGAHDAADADIMAFARDDGAVVLTHDLDFGAILAATQGERPSVVQIRAQDVSLESIGSHVVTALRQAAQELDDGALLTIDPNRARLTLLPLR